MPVWVPTDDVITERPDRQVLVVGDTVVGLVLTLLLRQAGYDPVIVSGTAPGVSTRVTYLCPPAVRTLDAVGIDTSVRGCGTTVESVSPDVSPSQSDPTVLSMETDRGDTPPLVVHPKRLRRALETRLPEQQHGGKRTVETLSRRDGGLFVEFGDGIRECFDIVVDTGGGCELRSAGGESPTADPLAQCEIPLDTDSLAQSGIRDHWRSDALVQAVQSPNGSGSVLRVTARPSDVDRVLDDANWKTVLRNGTDVVSEGAEFERTSVRQVRASDAVSDWWGTGRVAFCGPAACPVAPACGFDVTFGIEDAVAFVTALNGATHDVSDVVDTYSSGRADRLTTLWETIEAARADSEYPVPRSTTVPFDSLSVLRTVTLGTFFDRPLGSLQWDEFRAHQ